MTQWIAQQEKVQCYGGRGWSFHLAKEPGFPNTPVQKLIQEFHATHFLHALSKYMHRKLPGHTRRINEDTPV
ncbi:hypothetical protein JB92DRAFT_2864245, partial [Gautieria morchelliformis]